MDNLDREIEARERQAAKDLADKRQREILRGRHAEELLEDWLLAEVFQHIDDECMRMLREFPITQPEIGVQARLKLEASGTVKQLLQNIVDSGKLDAVAMEAERYASIEEDDEDV
jgi:hypothetical protein